MASNGTFTLTINTNATFGENAISENVELVYLLNQVAQDVGSGKPSRAIISRSGANVGSYTYGAGMLSAGR